MEASLPPLDERNRSGLFLRLLLGTALVQIAGRALDGYWHSRHDEFEGASQQLEAHWLIWLGVLATLVVCVLALRHLTASGGSTRGYQLTLLSGIGYVGVAIWHFIEHANLAIKRLPTSSS